MTEIALCLATVILTAQDVSQLEPYSGVIGAVYVLDSENWQLWNSGTLLPSYELIDDPHDGPTKAFVSKLQRGSRIKVEAVRPKKYHLLIAPPEARSGWDYYAVVSLQHPTHPQRRIQATIPFEVLVSGGKDGTHLHKQE